MLTDRLHLKIEALHTMGEAVKAAQKVLEADREAVIDGEEIACEEEHLEKMQVLYEECIECCIRDLMVPKK